jgi:hypothetical protein
MPGDGTGGRLQPGGCGAAPIKGSLLNESMDPDPDGSLGLYSDSRETEVSRPAVSPAVVAPAHVRNSRRVGRRWNRCIRGDCALVGMRHLLAPTLNIRLRSCSCESVRAPNGRSSDSIWGCNHRTRLAAKGAKARWGEEVALENEQRSWLLLPQVMRRTDRTTDISGTTLINLELVRRVEVISATKLKLWFSETYAETFEGSGATQLLETLLARAMHIDGKPVEFPIGAPDRTPSSA